MTKEHTSTQKASMGSHAPQMSRATLAAAAALLMLGTSFDAQALALGAITVQSALGEPLRAEIEIPQISSDEAASFEAKLGTPQAFSLAGVEYSATLAGTRVSFHRRSDGQAYLRLSGNQPINEPFLGLVIEANWSSGSLVRDYAMLLDPPGRAAPTAVVEASTQPTTAPVATESAPAPVAVRPAQARPAPAAPAPGVAEQVTPSPAPGKSAARTAASQVTVQRGTTASTIARAHAINGVSLDQMLIAMLQANPEAFIRGNVNLIRAGAVLRMPSQEQAQATSQAEARRLVVAQTRDFQAYRRSLAQKVPNAPAEQSTRSASGSVQAQVQDSQAPTPSEDRLTISKTESIQPDSTETHTAESRQAQEQSERVAELSKNLEELTKLQVGDSSAKPETETPEAQTSSVPGIDLPVGQPASATAPTSPTTETPADTASQTAADTDTTATAEQTADVPQDAGAETETDAASTDETTPETTTDSQQASETTAEPQEPAQPAPVAEAEPPKPAAPVRVPAPAPAPMAEPSFLDSLTENPLLPVAGAGLLALLAGFGVYRSRQRKKQSDASLDSEFVESQMQPDSFFGSSGGQHVDTKERSSGLGGSSMVYSPSQLDAAGDVDPVAEANVYLAYGRDGQAEDILKEALLTNPNRPSIHLKLAEIYAKRQDGRALEAIASEAHKITQGHGPEWQAIVALGQSLDPDNHLYQPGSSPTLSSPTADARPRTNQFGADTEPAMPFDPDSGPGALDSGPAALDLNLDLGAALSQPAPLESPAAPPDSAPALDLDMPLDLDMDAGELASPEEITRAAPIPTPSPMPAPVSAPAPIRADSEFVDLDLGMDFDPPAVEPAPVSTPNPLADPDPIASDSGMIEFDMSALSVDPDSRSGADIDTEQSEDADDDPLATKLALAQEFHAIGDTDGARDLAQEVLGEASGALKIRAERFLADL